VYNMAATILVTRAKKLSLTWLILLLIYDIQNVGISD
jgi:hypothetical protein